MSATTSSLGLENIETSQWADRPVQGSNRSSGDYQVYGESYIETQAPVVSFSTVQTFLYLALSENMHMAQIDLTSAFLNGTLEEDICDVSPRTTPNKETKVYKLKKTLHGLKQAHLIWHKNLYEDLERLGFVELSSAPCVLRKKAADTKTGAFYWFM